MRSSALPGGAQRPHVVQGLSVSEGLWVLQAQDNTMKFLTCCAKLILHDIPATEVFRSPLLPTPVLTPGKDTGFSSLAAMAAEAPYRLPAQLVFDRIVSLLAAKRDQAADHLWSLREDPSYFCDYAYEVNEHRTEMLRSESGLSHPDLEAKNEVNYWTRVIWKMVITDYMQLETFSELQNQAEALRQVYKSNAASIQPDCDLPDSYMHAILRFRYFLKEAAMIVSQAKLHVFQSPPWRDH